MTVFPTWFGPSGRPLFGWLHVPDEGLARGMAVLCGPIGREATNALPALRSAAEQLSARGIAALRFAYAGTGDSAGSVDDPHQVSSWLASVDDALEFAASVVSGPVVLVGMRAGALLAAEAVAGGARVDGLVHWDPCASGRDFLRLEQTLLATGYGVPQADDGSVSGPAFVYAPETVRDLTALQLEPSSSPEAPPTVVLSRASGLGVAGLKRRFAGSDVEWIAIEGQAELLDVYPDLLTLPAEAIAVAVHTIETVIDKGGAPATDVTAKLTEVGHVGRGYGDRDVTEHPVFLGPNRLFAIVTDPAGDTARGPFTVVLLPAGALDHSGPGRMWVELARRFAGDGMRVVRVDIDGIGETYGRPGQPRQAPKPPEAFDDLVDLARALGDPEGRNLILVGLSSGGYHGIEAGQFLRPRGICAINPGLSSPVYEVAHGPADPRRRAYQPMPRVLRDLAVTHARVAALVWRVLLVVWVARSPFAPIARVCRRGVPLLLIVTEHDAKQFEPSWYWAAVRRRLRRRGLLDIEVVEGTDHSLYTTEGKRLTYPLIARWVSDTYGRRRVDRRSGA